MSNTDIRYNKVAIGLHWLLALAILGMVFLGGYMSDLPRTDAGKYPLYQWHKSIGIIILLLSVLRLVWRLMHKVPAMPATTPHWQKWAAKLAHFGLYGLMLGLPLSGWAMVSASPLNIPTVLFGIIPWPHLPILPDLANKADYAKFFYETHELLVTLFWFLLAAHVAAALYHHFILRDDVLRRMLPQISTPKAAMGLVALSLLWPQGAYAKDWQVDFARSKIEFTGTESGAAFTGSFGKFSTKQLRFDPANPADSAIEVAIELGSVRAGSAERDSTLPSAEWFNTAQFPQAIFKSQTVRAVGDNGFIADGTLSIKGLEKPVQISFTLTPQADNPAGVTVNGTTTLNRQDWRLGYTDEGSVGNMVTVNLQLTAQAIGQAQ